MMNVAKEIFEANRDILIRIKKEKVKSTYIKEDDVLLISIGAHKITPLSFEIANDYIVVHYNPKTYEIVGFTLPYVKEFLEWHAKQMEGKRIDDFDKIKDRQIIDTVTSSSISGLNECAYA